MIVRSQPTWRQLPRQQQQFFSCCCGYSDVTCGECANPAPAQFALSVAGITNSACTNCSRWNGDFILTNDSLVFPSGNPCRWSSPVETGAAPCAAGCGNCSRWQLVVSSTAAELLADGNLMAAYTIAKASYDCDGPNTLPYFADSLACITWPASLTLTPL